jgi:hypothetical protein
VLRESDAGKPTTQVAKEFRCSRAWVRRVKQEARQLCKFGPYQNRLLNRHTRPLRERIKDVLIQEPSITVEQLRQAFGPEIGTAMLIGIREELYINKGVYWHGAENSLPASDISKYAVRPIPPRFHDRFDPFLKQGVRELITWKPEITVDELERILGTLPDAELVAEVKIEIELKRAIEERDERERVAQRDRWWQWLRQNESRSKDFYP